MAGRVSVRPGVALDAAEMEELQALADRPRTAEEDAELAAIRREVEAEFPPAGAAPEVAEVMAAIRQAREGLGLSLADVAERSGIDPGALSRLERGRGNPTVGTLGRMARAVGARLSLVLVPDGR